MLHGMWELLGPGIEPVSPALTGEFFTTKPTGKPSVSIVHLWRNSSLYILFLSLKDTWELEGLPGVGH